MGHRRPIKRKQFFLVFNCASSPCTLNLTRAGEPFPYPFAELLILASQHHSSSGLTTSCACAVTPVSSINPRFMTLSFVSVGETEAYRTSFYKQGTAIRPGTQEVIYPSSLTKRPHPRRNSTSQR